MENNAKTIIDAYRQMFGIENAMEKTRNILEKCTNDEGKHIDFDALMESSKTTVKGLSYVFAKDIWEIIANTNMLTFKITNNFVPKCGFQK